VISSALRRQSSPLARIIRDFVALKRPMVALALGGAILFAMVAMTQESTTHNRQAMPGTEKVKETGQDLQ
jgi:hypothetical protein